MMRGRELKAKLAQLCERHRIRPIERAALPLLAATSAAQIVEGVAASPDVDSDRMSFQAGSLSWPNLETLPFLIRHDAGRIAGKILALDYDADGRLRVKALVEDSEARRMGGFSICATVLDSEVREEDSCCFHALIKRAIITEISMTDRPANPRAFVISRYDASADASFDDALAGLKRLQARLNDLAAQIAQAPSPPPPRPEIKAAPPHIIGRLPAACLLPKRTEFASLVRQIEQRHHHAG